MLLVFPGVLSSSSRLICHSSLDPQLLPGRLRDSPPPALSTSTSVSTEPCYNAGTAPDIKVPHLLFLFHECDPLSLSLTTQPLQPTTVECLQLCIFCEIRCPAYLFVSGGLKPNKEATHLSICIPRLYKKSHDQTDRLEENFLSKASMISDD